MNIDSIEPNKSLTLAAGRSPSAEPDGEPSSTTTDSAPSRRPDTAPEIARNVLLFEAPAHEMDQVLAETQRAFPTAIPETPDETARHRQLFLKESDGLPATAPDGAITLALRFESAPPETPFSIPGALVRVKEIIGRWSKTVTIGHLYFDTRLVPSAIAMVYCKGPFAGGSNSGVIGSFSGQRDVYYRLKRHFYSDENTFFRDVAVEAGEAQIEYPYRQEWSDGTSPLRIQFLSEDPARDGWGLANGSDSPRPADEFLLKGGSCLRSVFPLARIPIGAAR